MSRKARPTRTLVAFATWLLLATVSAGIVALTTTEGVIADSYVVKLYRFLGDEQRIRVALSRLLNGLTVSTPHRPHLDLLFAELRAASESRWLFDKATRVLLRLGHIADARRFMERWETFDGSAPAITRALEIAVADKRAAVALERCKLLAENLRSDPSLALTCADIAAAAEAPDLAREFTLHVRDNAMSSTKPLLAAHIAARDADDAVRENRLTLAREAIARGLRAIGTFEPTTLAIELRPVVIRLLLADARIRQLDPPTAAKRLLLAVSVIEKTPELAGVTREFLAGAISRHAEIYDAVAASATAFVKASPEFAEWWSRTGLSASAPDAAQLREQRIETLARIRRPARDFSLRFSIADLPDRIHNVGLFAPFGLVLFLALSLSTRLGGFSRGTTTLLAATGFAALLEAIQFVWIPRRHADINDVWTATVGALIGVLVVVAFAGLARLARRTLRRRS
jgi:hypothetical protein